MAQTITTEQFIELFDSLPSEKQAHWYDYGLFLLARAEMLAPKEIGEESALSEETAVREAEQDG